MLQRTTGTIGLSLPFANKDKPDAFESMITFPVPTEFDDILCSQNMGNYIKI